MRMTDGGPWYGRIKCAITFTLEHSRSNMTTRHFPLLFVVITTLSLSCAPSLFAQTTIQIGHGTVLNNAFLSPSPYPNVQPGGRVQMLFPAGELQGAGMSAGTVSAIGFDVFAPSGTTLSNYVIRMGTTAADELGSNWETGLTDVWGPADHTDVVGWNTHDFLMPFTWDGISNLVVEVCVYDGFYTQNARVFQTETSYVSSASRSSFSTTICSDGGGGLFLLAQRPNVRFLWLSQDAPPVAMPTAEPPYSCDGTIAFADTSTVPTDTQAWDFGDGTNGSGSNVVHSYSSSGTYTATLVSTNAYGVDTATVSVTVDLNAVPPVAACDVPSSGSVAGFGILDVTIQGIQHSSGDALSEGYLDNTCQAITVAQGTPLNISIMAGNVAQQAVRAWVDWDNSGSFSVNELLASGNGPVVNGSMLVPSGAALGTPLRLRAIAAYGLVTPDPSPCGTVEFGQAEDYTIIVAPNPDPPLPFFSAAPLFSCDGSVQFSDMSQNAPTAWTWDFGDGGSSNVQNPLHQYSASGTYSVSLLASNPNGQADTLLGDLITVDLGSMLPSAGCIPNTQAYCCGYGILGFQFEGINSVSPDGIEGYQDRSCGNTASVVEGESYTWSVTTDAGAPQDVRLWIDMDNNGNFGPGELLATALNTISPSGTVSIPPGSVFGTPVRLRVQADVIGQSSGPCDAPLYGQSEDFSAIIAQNTVPPVAAFTATPTGTCDGHSQFTDLSTHVPTSWAWDFGDGTTSTEQNPEHTYSSLGQYTVSLTVTNTFGSDMATHPNFINYVPDWACDTLSIPIVTAGSSTLCTGLLSDDGGPTNDYTPGFSEAFVISPVGAETVTLNFIQFQWGNNPNRHLAIYDGPSPFDPLLAQLTGNMPPSGPIVSSGPTIMLRQEQISGGGTSFTGPGFLLRWECSTVGIHESDKDPFASIHPVPADQWFDVELWPDASNVRTLSVVNVNGQVVLEQSVPPHGTRIHVDRADWPSGPYAVRLRSPEGQWVRTIIFR